MKMCVTAFFATRTLPISVRACGRSVLHGGVSFDTYLPLIGLTSAYFGSLAAMPLRSPDLVNHKSLDSDSLNRA